jgi:hypothetical protein
MPSHSFHPPSVAGKFLLTARLLLSCAISFAQPLRFVKEKIDFTADHGAVVVAGEYYFANPSADSCRAIIEYPIVSGSMQSSADSIRLTGASDGKALDFDSHRGGLRFVLVLAPFERKAIRIRYRQAVRSRRFEYLLTSTAAWGRALDLAEYRIRLPGGCSLKSCSLAVDGTRFEDGRVVLSIRRENFMPDRNLVVEWEREGGKP